MLFPQERKPDISSMDLRKVEECLTVRPMQPNHGQTDRSPASHDSATLQSPRQHIKQEVGVGLSPGSVNSCGVDEHGGIGARVSVERENNLSEGGEFFSDEEIVVSALWHLYVALNVHIC